MQMERYLEQLLYRHECVIIPGLGGFVSNYMPARVNPSTHLFSPPSRVLTFNRNLRNNDGLLANHISFLEGLSFAQALEKVRQFVQEAERALLAGDQLIITGIGSLRSDNAGKIEFIPAEGHTFLQESFGLKPFRFPPIRREELIKKVEKQFKDRVAPEVVEQGVRKRKVRPVRVIAMAASVLLLAALVYIPWQTSVMEQHGLADLNPFKGLKPRSYSERTVTNPVLQQIDLNEEKGLEFSDADTYTTFSPNAESLPLVVRLKESSALPDKTHVVNSSKTHSTHSTGRYHLIAGAFAVAGNADNYVVRLRSEGLEAGIMDQQFSVLRYVSVGNFQTKEEALMEMNKIKGTHPDVWLLIK